MTYNTPVLLNVYELYAFAVLLLLVAGIIGWRVRRAIERGGWIIRCTHCARNLRWAILRRESVCPHCGAPIAYNPDAQSCNPTADDDNA